MLFIVPTPLGNLDDITLRALAALRSADTILCEDTRRTLALAAKFQLTARIERYNEHSPASLVRALELLDAGRKIALVCDGGTPCVSDPGWRLVKAAAERGHKIESLPGPCAAVCAFAGSGMGGGGFLFAGFLPRKKSKIIRLLTDAAKTKKPVVIYESPFRLVKLLDIVCQSFGPETETVVARELTKLHEEWLRGTAAGVKAALAARKEIKGEIVAIISPRPAVENESEDPES